MTRRGGVAGDGLLHPLPVAALAVLLFNDHLLKRAWPGLVTGKLSDVAGLILFPLLLQALLEIGGRWLGRPVPPSVRVAAACSLLTALAFAALKTLPAAAELYATLGAELQSALFLRGAPAPGVTRRLQIVCDPTDLLALPGCLLALWVNGTRCPRAAQRSRRAAHPA